MPMAVPSAQGCRGHGRAEPGPSGRAVPVLVGVHGRRAFRSRAGGLGQVPAEQSSLPWSPCSPAAPAACPGERLLTHQDLAFEGQAGRPVSS